jgi:hypothetical protein
VIEHIGRLIPTWQIPLNRRFTLPPTPTTTHLLGVRRAREPRGGVVDLAVVELPTIFEGLPLNVADNLLIAKRAL